MIFKDLLGEDIEKGIRGENLGIPTGFKNMDSNTNGIQKSIYTLVGGNSGTGKTSFVDLAYCLNPYEWYVKNKDKTDIKIKIIYRSMERNTKYKIAKWTCLKMFKDNGIIMDVPTLLGWQGKRFEITEELKTSIYKTGEYFDEMFSSGFIEILDGPENPTGIFNHIHEFAEANGEMQQVNKFSKRYVPKDKNLHVIIINDHIGKLKGEGRQGKAFTERELVNKHSEYMGIVRDKFGYIPVDISQFNRSIGSVDRMKAKSVSPEPDDFKGSSSMYENADVALGLFNPYKFKVNDFLGYDIPRFVAPSGENRFRSVSIIKNSYGADDIIVPLNFLGENGNFREMPSPEAFVKDPNNYKNAREFTK